MTYLNALAMNEHETRQNKKLWSTIIMFYELYQIKTTLLLY